MPGPGISVCIVCRNEADRLGDCLASVAWADEVLVMDLESSDGSGDLARERGARVFEREPLPIVEPLRDELAARASNAWIVALDPDERVTPGLAEELRRISVMDAVDAVVMPRMNIDFGHPPSHPGQRYEPQLRMYRRDRVRWPHFPNRLPEVPEERLLRIAQRDELVLTHIRNRNLPEALERAMRYAPAQAAAMLEAGERFTAPRMIKAIANSFHKEFVTAEAWRDGVPGLIRAIVLVNYKVSVWIALWQQSGVGRTRSDDRVVAAIGRPLAVLVHLAWVLRSPLRRLRQPKG